MAYPNIFSTEVANKMIARIDTLQPNSAALWGKMNVAQMLAHCCVAYEFVYTTKHPKPNAFVRFLLKMLAKNVVVGEKPYAKNGRTAKEFLITDPKEFEAEKTRLIGYINQTLQLGAASFEGKESHGFGKLTTVEWNNLFYKHLDHHLGQFGV
jgi:hypothetical protein